MQKRYLIGAPDPVRQVTTEREASSFRQFFQAGEGVVALTAGIATGSAADFLPANDNHLRAGGESPGS